jgi:hypothetical protein
MYTLQQLLAFITFFGFGLFLLTAIKALTLINKNKK